MADESAPPGSERGTVLEARGLNVVYRLPSHEIAAIKHFKLAIREREVVGLVGESGSGKSTAALALLGLVRPPGKIIQGEVIFRGQELLNKSDKELQEIRGRRIALILQNPRAALNPLVRVGTQIANAYRAHHAVNRSEASLHAVSSLEKMGIPDARRRARSFPHQLSGGMAQRVLIAMATINEPSLLVADEPTTGLDVTVQAQILDLLRAQVLDVGSSMLFVTHDLGIVARYCDRVAVMLDGEIVEEGPVESLFFQPKHPYSQRLISSSPERAKAIGGPG